MKKRIWARSIEFSDRLSESLYSLLESIIKTVGWGWVYSIINVNDKLVSDLCTIEVINKE